ncbi:MAG: hypothetical protein DHS20C15_26040 [Planctomycetota bacterium]|nr:MAG: hypothetical protein DHS20C15_26040 [Planctomycetota bacterium]
MLRGFITLAAVLAFALPTSAQDLDGVWFKLKVKSKGVTVENAPVLAEGGLPGQMIKKASFKATAWLLLENALEEGGSDPAYRATVVTEVEDGVFDISNIEIFDVIGDRLLVNGFLGFVTPKGAVGAECTLEAKVKLDKEDALKSAKIKALGANVALSGLTVPGLGEGDSIAYFGGMTVKGSTVKLAKLPFDPIEVLDDGEMLAKLKAPGTPWVFGAQAAERETSAR